MPLPSTLGITLLFVAVLNAQSPKEVSVTRQARGSFDVSVKPLTEGVRPDAWAPGRLSIDKRFKGDLEAASQGEMLAATTEVQGSAGYTAIEKVSGRLQGRSGTFLLQHFAVMARGVPGEWIVQVIPDSGTGGLKGLTGRLLITITGKQHDYVLEYTLPAEAEEAAPQR
ncbi:MAG TPA: DUF3224 domain-containing protein [Geothrix sp.]|nr:DUF3224 domain-containing protein [Geothrix sp.]